MTPLPNGCASIGTLDASTLYLVHTRYIVGDDGVSLENISCFVLDAASSAPLAINLTMALR